MQERPALRRVFAAIEINVSPELRDALAALRKLGSPIRPVREEQLHLTIKFFGEIPLDQISLISERLDVVGANHPAFDWSLRGLGAFPTLERMSVVWTGATNADSLKNLASSLSNEFEMLGFAPERRPFHPHVTLARVKARPPKAAAELIRASSSVEYGGQHACEIVLFESTLEATGPIYNRLHVARLKAR